MSGQAVFILVSIVLIIAWTAYNISTVRRTTRLMRELERLREANAGDSRIDETALSRDVGRSGDQKPE